MLKSSGTNRGRLLRNPASSLAHAPWPKSAGGVGFAQFRRVAIFRRRARRVYRRVPFVGGR